MDPIIIHAVFYVQLAGILHLCCLDRKVWGSDVGQVRVALVVAALASSEHGSCSKLCANEIVVRIHLHPELSPIPGVQTYRRLKITIPGCASSNHTTTARTIDPLQDSLTPEAERASLRILRATRSPIYDDILARERV